MLALTMAFEAHILHAHRNPEGKWRVFIAEATRGLEVTVEWTDREFGVVLCLMLCGDDQPGADALYEVAEPLFAALPTECRLIP